MDTKDKLKVCGCAIGGYVMYRWIYQFILQGCLFPDVFTIFGLAAVCLILDIMRLKPGKSYRLHAVFLQYAVQKGLRFIGYLVHKRLKAMSRNIQDHQNDLLLKILGRNSDTDVGRAMGVDKVKNTEDFRKMIPLTNYQVYEPFINKIEEAETKNVFFHGNVDYIAWTSGTTSGKSKRFPKSLSLLRKTSAKWLILAQRCLISVPGNHFIRKWLAVRCCPPLWRSKSGIKCGPISGLASNYSLNSYVVPDIANSFTDEEKIIYINLVFGLKYPDICNLFFSTAQMALHFFQTLERTWKEICDDIEKGTISEIRIGKLPTKDVDILRMSLGGGDAKRANYLRTEFEIGFEGIVPRVWPECPGLFCLATGSFQIQADVVKEKYLGSVPLFSPFHAGTETFYGINLNLEKPEVTYTPMVPFNYFEFIPISQIEEENPDTLLCNQVAVGGCYELVVTTWEGLYRYRTEDIVQITEFFGTIPCYKFVRRKTDVLNATTERVPESLLSEAVRTVATACNKQILNFVTTENIHVERVSGYISEHRYYMVFLELQNEQVLTEEEEEMVDTLLTRLHDMYKMYRDSGSLKSVKVVPVRGGTFQSMGKLIRSLNKTSSLMQFKLPRIVRQPELLQYLLENMVQTCDFTGVGNRNTTYESRND